MIVHSAPHKLKIPRYDIYPKSMVNLRFVFDGRMRLDFNAYPGSASQR